MTKKTQNLLLLAGAVGLGYWLFVGQKKKKKPVVLSKEEAELKKKYEAEVALQRQEATQGYCSGC